MRPFDDAVASLVVLTTGLRDHHRDAFDAAKADLLRLTRGKASALTYVRRIAAAELNGPHVPQWKVSAAEFERRRQQGPLVVSCGNQRRQSVVVVAPCGHVGKSQSGLSTCPCGLVVHELEAVS